VISLAEPSLEASLRPECVHLLRPDAATAFLESLEVL
jgi:hypothetical protein